MPLGSPQLPDAPVFTMDAANTAVPPDPLVASALDVLSYTFST